MSTERFERVDFVTTKGVVRTHVVWFHRVRAYDDHSRTGAIEQRLICGQRVPDRRLNGYSIIAVPCTNCERLAKLRGLEVLGGLR